MSQHTNFNGFYIRIVFVLKLSSYWNQMPLDPSKITFITVFPACQERQHYTLYILSNFTG